METKPPKITLLWCPQCGRHDRHQSMSYRHFSNGKRCDGVAIRVAYEPVRQRPLDR